VTTAKLMERDPNKRLTYIDLDFMKQCITYVVYLKCPCLRHFSFDGNDGGCIIRLGLLVSRLIHS
jgi:hypothetical protein